MLLPKCFIFLKNMFFSNAKMVKRTFKDLTDIMCTLSGDLLVIKWSELKIRKGRFKFNSVLAIGYR